MYDWIWRELQSRLDESLAAVRVTQEKFHGTRYWEA